MITLAQLTGADRRTYQRILHEPAVTDMRRDRVRSLLETLGQVVELPEAELRVTRNGHVLILPGANARTKESTRVVTTLRNFLKRSEIPRRRSNGREAHLLLVIGHHHARVFRSVVGGGGTEQLLPTKNRAPLKIPLARRGKARAPGAEFLPVAAALQAPGRILILGESSATQQEMDQFMKWVKQRDPSMAKRIIGSLVIDQDQADAGLILATAQAYYAKARSAQPPLGDSPAISARSPRPKTIPKN